MIATDGTLRLDAYVVDVLLRDLAGHDRSPAAFLVFLFLWRRTHGEKSPRVRLSLDVFNLFDAKDSDIDYFYTSRLRGEPADGIEDIHLHPALPRTARVNLIVGF